MPQCISYRHNKIFCALSCYFTAIPAYLSRILNCQFGYAINFTKGVTMRKNNLNKFTAYSIHS
ncbi:hypothetical protein PROSTU_03974 [Providencia stuartii ATCC 25827]|uniref:Uncharacterized protein n=1 Tax=Providencia stuartii ATCC 25827 TaxID=471874 RepID=A0AA86YWQ6_PROST|nr:hypothetical protein PROSTU_03974 [Providencia stuartii ATCC 25827]